ncbi:hypothetical protein HMN09_00745400 [Mycena chlorophos]|uniref:Fungal-type protein kinase domain-containing protein n=1 Tax=Mycena chlorophos TaxID=658473 RepID=A0A8H6W5S1_MYCCL|nr:hypothetical protein HMN09_00745400 [Mycena chlorophos]
MEPPQSASASERDDRDNDATKRDSELDTAVASPHTTVSLPVHVDETDRDGATSPHNPVHADDVATTPPNSTVGFPNPTTPANYKPHTQRQFATNREFVHRSKNPIHEKENKAMSDGLVEAVTWPVWWDEFMQPGDVERLPSADKLQEIAATPAVAESLSKLVRVGQQAGGEKRLYDPVVEYFDALARALGLPAKHQPDFVNTHKTHFPPLLPTDHKSSPDITASRAAGSGIAEWFFVIFNVENKTADLIKVSADGVQTTVVSGGDLTQLLNNARRIFMEGRFCFVFLISVFEAEARFYRVDHSAFVVSPAFNYCKPENNTIFAEFFWRLFKSHDEGRILGEDLTVSIPTVEERLRMYPILRQVISQMGGTGIPTRGRDRQLTDTDDVKADDGALARSRWVEVMFGGKKERCLTVGEPIFRSGGLFSRGTRVDCVLREEEEEPRLYVLKDAWAQVCRHPESVFYDIVNDYVVETGQDWPLGLTKLEGYYNLGDLADADRTGHRTITARRRSGGHVDQERAHRRTLTALVGQSLEELQTFRNVVIVLQSVITGHWVAYKAGVMHRDISFGNVLATLSEEGRRSGFLHDFDNSTLTAAGEARLKKLFKDLRTSELPKDAKDLTGTFPFLAIDILWAHSQNYRPWLSSPPSPFAHAVHYDLESFYWLLIWVVLRHIQCLPGAKDHDGYRREAARVFDIVDGDSTMAVASKARWLSDARKFSAPHNPPLAWLIRELSTIVNKSRSYDNDAPQPATHEMFLDAFDRALKMEGWPVDDMDVATFVDMPKEETFRRTVATPKSVLAKAFPEAKSESKSRRLQTGATSSQTGAPAAPFAEPPSPAMGSSSFLKRKREGGHETVRVAGLSSSPRAPTMSAKHAAQLAKLEQRRLEILEKARREAEELEREAAMLAMELDTEDGLDPDSAQDTVTV